MSQCDGPERARERAVRALGDCGEMESARVVLTATDLPGASRTAMLGLLLKQTKPLPVVRGGLAVTCQPLTRGQSRAVSALAALLLVAQGQCVKWGTKDEGLE